MNNQVDQSTGEKSASPGSQTPLKVMIVAGEASGDKHGASLVRAVRRISPQPVEFFGAGGDEMRQAGVDTLVDARDVAIMGIPEIAKALGRLYSAYRRLIQAARRRKPDAVVLVDWPDFNLRLARRFHLDGFKVVYYISPQIWAWRRYRVRAIRKYVDRMLVILPFEDDFYREHDVPVEYVGHPLAGAVESTRSRQEFAEASGLDPSRPLIAMLPGSRHKEIHYHLPALIEAASLIKRDWKGLASGSRSGLELEGLPQFVCPLASTVSRDQVRAITGQHPQAGELPFTFIDGDTYNAVGHSEIAVVASGTATVETGLLGVPMVVIYRGSELNWRLIRPLIHLDTFGMVNLIAGRRIVPELIQHDMTPQSISREVLSILSDAGRIELMKSDLQAVRERLSGTGIPAPERAAMAVLDTARQPAGSHP